MFWQDLLGEETSSNQDLKNQKLCRPTFNVTPPPYLKMESALCQEVLSLRSAWLWQLQFWTVGASRWCLSAKDAPISSPLSRAKADKSGQCVLLVFVFRCHLHDSAESAAHHVAPWRYQCLQKNSTHFLLPKISEMSGTRNPTKRNETWRGEMIWLSLATNRAENCH